MPAPADPYRVLGISPDATLDELQAAYRRAALKWHPDLSSADPNQAARRFRQVKEAYETILSSRVGGARRGPGSSATPQEIARGLGRQAGHTPWGRWRTIRRQILRRRLQRLVLYAACILCVLGIALIYVRVLPDALQRMAEEAKVAEKHPLAIDRAEARYERLVYLVFVPVVVPLTLVIILALLVRKIRQLHGGQKW